MKHICERCVRYRLKFQRKYSPKQYFAGYISSDVWIVGLNPKNDVNCVDPRSKEDLRAYFSNKEDVHHYFRDFRSVSERLFSMLGQPAGAGHTDIVKCFSNKFPPTASSREAREIIANCRPYFEAQLQQHCPKMIICNGRKVCEVIKNIIPLSDDHETYYSGRFRDHAVSVMLSGFIGRIDNFAKRRLGKEIESLLEALANHEV